METKMNRFSVYCYMLILVVLEIAVKTQMTAAHGSSHGNLQESILVEGASYNFQELTADAFSPEEDEPDDSHSLLFDPPYVAFGSRPLGVPHDARVVIANRGNSTVQFVAVSGNSPTFHSSFFEEKVVHPGGNTSFNIVFLGREMGTAETDLFIHTSVGTHKYKVSGTSISSAYRLHPLVGLKLPYNASFSPLIYMHNPHDHALQITEVYCSGGAISLELPDGALEGPQSMWHVPPHATRPIIAVRYGPRYSTTAQPVAGMHTAYVRIKVNDTTPFLVVAVEVTPGSETGPFASQPNLDFGMGGTKDAFKQVRLYMGNSSPRWLRIASISILPGVSADNALESSTESLSAPGIKASVLTSALMAPYQETHVATLTIDWRAVYESGNCCGSLVIRTRSGGHKVVLPYVSQPLQGGLTFNHSTVRFRSNNIYLLPLRTLKLTNEYDVGVYVTDIELADNLEQYFEVTDFKPKAIAPSKSTSILSIRLKNWTDRLKFQSRITVHTNVSSLVVPIYIYNGRLDIVLSIPCDGSDPDLLDFGLVGTSSTTRATIKLVNTNPLPVCISTYGIHLEGGALQFLGCARGDNDDNITSCTCVPPGHRGIATLSTVAPTRETGYLTGLAWITTEHHNHTIKVILTVAKGRLALAQPLVMDGCFAGTICSRPLKIQSQFYIGMNVVSVDTDPPDGRIYLRADDPLSKIIMPRETSHIGDICYDPAAKCNGECYTTLDLNSTVGLQWLSRMSLPIDTRPSDLNLLNSRYYLYMNLTTTYPTKNFTLRMDTTNVRLHSFPAAVKIVMTWPYLAVSDSFTPIKVIEAPLIQVGTWNEIGPGLLLRNPSTTNRLLVQLAMDWMLPNYGREDLPVQMMHDDLRPPTCSPPCDPAPIKAFHILPSAMQLTTVPKELELFSPHPDSQLFMLDPGQAINLTIGFKAEDATRVTGLLYIRNNLTGVEVIRFIGQGAYPSLRFGNRKPGSVSPLLFEVTERHLKDCDKNKKLTPQTTNLTVKRSFTARNTGDITIVVTKFFINGLECEGYGYKVLNCQGFTLAPNSTRKIDIAFTPDFTLSRIHRTLVLETSLHSAVNFSLLTTLPAHLLAQCRACLPRPAWESFIRTIAVYFMACTGICVLFAGFYESDRILISGSVVTGRDRSVSDAILDLKSIGQMGSKNGKINGWESHYSPQRDKKPLCIKPAPWPSECPADDGKVTSNGSAKYEEVTPPQRSKKKLSKKNSNTSADSNDVQVVIKEKKASPPNGTSQSWRSIFSNRNNMTSSKTNDTKETSSRSDIKAASEEVIEKVVEVPKKITPDFGNTDIKARDHSQSQYTNRKQKPKDHPYCYDEEALKNKRLSPPCCEEDASSTTTESSNNDEADKENDGSTTSSSKSSTSTTKKVMNSGQGNAKKKSSSQYKDNYEGDGEDEEYDHKPSNATPNYAHSSFSQKLKTKENTQNIMKQKMVSNKTEKLKSAPENTKFLNSDVTQNDQPVHHKQTKSKTFMKVQNSKRDKQQLTKKRSLDKGFVYVAKPDPQVPLNIPISSVRISSASLSTTPLSCWKENKASFSDVVSRSDTATSYSNIVASQNNPKMTPDRKPSQNRTNLEYGIGSESYAELQKPTVEHKTNLGPIGFYSKNFQKPWSDVSNDAKQTVRPIQKPQLSTPDDALNSNNSFFFFNSDTLAGSPDVSLREPKSVGVIGRPQEKYLNPIGRPDIYASSNLEYGQHLNSFVDDPLLQPLEEIPTYDDEQSLLQSNGLMSSFRRDILPDDMAPLQTLNDYMGSWNLHQSNADYRHLADHMYNGAYGRNVFIDSSAGWPNTQSLWDNPMGSVSSQSISDQTAASTAGMTNSSNVYGQGNVCAEKDAAEWLWGYSSAGLSTSADNGIGQPNIAPAPPGISQPQDQAAFDPFRSLCSIWSPGWTVDQWNVNEQDKDNNPQL